MNRAAEMLTGSPSSEAFGSSIEEVYRMFTPEGERVDRCPLRQALESGTQTERAQFTLESLTGQRLVIDDTTAPINDAEGRLTGAVTVIQDVTQRILAEQERERLLAKLKRSNAELTRFSYSVSHDLQEPVRTIKGFSELLTRKFAGRQDESETDLLRMISAAAEHMQKLIASLLVYAQLGEGELKRESVDLREVIEVVRLNLDAAMRDAGATLTCGELPTITADRVQLERASRICSPTQSCTARQT
jgi:PAS domain S-box-containing protein